MLEFLTVVLLQCVSAWPSSDWFWPSQSSCSLFIGCARRTREATRLMSPRRRRRSVTPRRTTASSLRRRSLPFVSPFTAASVAIFLAAVSLLRTVWWALENVHDTSSNSDDPGWTALSDNTARIIVLRAIGHSRTLLCNLCHIETRFTAGDFDLDSADIRVHALGPENCRHFSNICLGKSGPFVHLNTKTRQLVVSLKNVAVSKLHHLSVCIYAVCYTFISLCGSMYIMYTGWAKKTGHF